MPLQNTLTQRFHRIGNTCLRAQMGPLSIETSSKGSNNAVWCNYNIFHYAICTWTFSIITFKHSRKELYIVLSYDQNSLLTRSKWIINGFDHNQSTWIKLNPCFSRQRHLARRICPRVVLPRSQGKTETYLALNTESQNHYTQNDVNMGTTWYTLKTYMATTKLTVHSGPNKFCLFRLFSSLAYATGRPHICVIQGSLPVRFQVYGYLWFYYVLLFYFLHKNNTYIQIWNKYTINNCVTYKSCTIINMTATKDCRVPEPMCVGWGRHHISSLALSVCRPLSPYVTLSSLNR